MRDPAPIRELRVTVERMGAAHRSSGDPEVRRLLGAYDDLVPRFEADLGDERDVLLSRGATLMLIQESARAPKAVACVGSPRTSLGVGGVLDRKT